MSGAVAMQVQSFTHNTRLLYVSASRYSSDWHSILHSHTNAEFFYVLEGRGRFRVEGGDFVVEKDDIVIVNANINHTELPLGKNEFEYIVLGLEGTSFFDQIRKSDEYLHFSCRDNREKVLFLLEMMLKEVEQKEADYSHVCQDLLDILIVVLLRVTGASIKAIETKRSSKECDRVKRYIDSHFTEDLSLEYLAEMTHLSKFYLVHIFKKEVGVTPIAYLNNKRIEESRSLLSSTNHPISKISEHLGFATQSYFGYCFKAQVGVTPVEYRKNANNTPFGLGQGPLRPDLTER